MKLLSSLLALVILLHGLIWASPAMAVYDPGSVPNNKVGIHLISPTDDEVDPADILVNSTGGDWGYVTVLIQENDRKVDKWQTFFDNLRRRHLIPIVRIATKPAGDYWEVPHDGLAKDWAEFLDSLNWPIKNRYVVVYNEPNHGKEWGNRVDPASYAKVLDATITALKDKNSDFFVMNAGLDASTPYEPPAYMDEETYLRVMNETIPGIFNRLDGWSSHSYPNPGFVASPNGTGKGSVRTFEWEQRVLRGLGLGKDLPVFITETGWKHSDGKTEVNNLPSPEKVADYYKNAFENAWNKPNIIAVSPFVLNYQDEPFSHFSFKKYTGEPQDDKVLGAQYPDYQPQYQTVASLSKTDGQPIQENEAKLVGGMVYPAIVPGQKYTIHLTFENTGQSIWNDDNKISLKVLSGKEELGVAVAEPDNSKVEPKGTKTFYLDLIAPETGIYKLTVNLFRDDKEFDSEAIAFRTEVKAPVRLNVISKLKWKSDYAGEYVLSMASSFGGTLKHILLNKDGKSETVDDPSLLPDQEYEFTLTRPYYEPKTIHQTLRSGDNTLDFGELDPNISSAILQPTQLWKLLPFTN